MMMIIKKKKQQQTRKLKKKIYHKNENIKDKSFTNGGMRNNSEENEKEGEEDKEKLMIFPSIRWTYILNNWLQGILCLLWISVVSCQRIVPMLVRGRLVTINSLQLCVPANLCWFLAFYCVFKANFAILAEVTHYPIKQFYEDWWNATTVEDFWRRWNVPVHDFAVHHVVV
mmetsp:Transcript_11621/g.19156  ORF Transcript_11621/g.19156 Transcript_11621/m.19156 type:complete len:171 (+) Transcript_11621:172-684(+)